MIKLITWEMDRSKTPIDREERIKHTMTLCEMVKKSMDSGEMMMWGINPGGNHGFGLMDADEKDIFAHVAQYIPHVKFKVESMLSIDEVMDALKNIQKSD